MRCTVARLAVLVVSAVMFTGCGHVTAVSLLKRPSAPLHGPRMVVFLNSGNVENTKGLAPVEFALGEHLRLKGFEVKRFAKEDGSIPYGLELRGEIDDRCSEGGFKFDWLEVVVVDLRANEEVMGLRGEGYSDDCVHWGKPGTMFSEMAEQIRASWQETTGL